MKILVDTNVLLDVLAKREPYYENSAMIWSLAESGRIDTNISSISFNNIVHIARKQEDAKKSFEAIMFLRDVFKPVDKGQSAYYHYISSIRRNRRYSPCPSRLTFQIAFDTVPRDPICSRSPIQR